MLEIGDEMKIEHGTLSGLRLKRDSGRQLLAELNEELSRLCSGIEEKTTRLKRLNRECLLGQREVKESQNRIFSIKEELAKMDEDAYRLQAEFEKREADLKRLQREKREAADGIIDTEKGIVEVSGSIPALEREKENLARHLAERQEERQALSDEISEALSETSLEKEGIEERMMELNTLFLARIQERNAVGERVAEFERAENALKEDIVNLEGERDLFEKIKVLRGERDAFKPVIETLEEEQDQLASGAETKKETLERRQDELDALVDKSCALKEEIKSLEKEVAEYDEALGKRNKAREHSENSLDVIEKDLEEFRALFANRRDLQTTLFLMDEKIEAIEGLDLGDENNSM